MNKSSKLFIASLLCAGLAGCGGGGGGGTVTPPPDPPGPPTGGPTSPGAEKLRLDAFANCDAYSDYLTEALTERALNRGFAYTIDCADTPGVGAICAPVDTAAVADLVTPTAFSVELPDAVSGTNLRVEGVDEADIVKADAAGNIYYLEHDRLLVSDAFPATELNLIGSVDLPDAAYAQSMLLDEPGNRLIVFQIGHGQFFPQTGNTTTLAAGYWGEPAVNVLIYDVTDPAAPSLSVHHRLQGNMIGVRRSGDRVHLVSSTYLALPAFLIEDAVLRADLDVYYQAIQDSDADTANAREPAIRTRIAELIRQNLNAAFLPTVELNVQTGGAVTEPLLACDAISRPDLTLDMGLVTVSSFDLDGGNLESTAVINNSYQMYGSAENLYLVQNSGGWFFSDTQRNEAAIYKIAIGAGAPAFRGHGLVDGNVTDGFALDEHDGLLRVATHERLLDDAGVTRTNHLFVLEDDTAGKLQVVGEVRDYGADERIFAVRFMGDRGFVVTFRQIDPLFAFDLSTPTAPVLAGELEIPGFSEYIHPLGDNHLLTLGRGGAQNRAIKLQIFDVSDLANPTLAHAYEPPLMDGHSYSVAEYEPKAFTFFAPRDLLSIPFSAFDNGWSESFNGFLYFDVDAAAGFTELGRVNHNDLVQSHSSCDVAPGVFCTQVWVTAEPLRSVVMTAGDATFVSTISRHGIKTTSAQEPSVELGSMTWPVEDP